MSAYATMNKSLHGCQMTSAAKQTSMQSLHNLGLPISADADTLYDYLANKKVPETIGFIEQNVQDVKGVIGKDTAELYNLIKRLANTGAYRAASLQLYACNASMQQENPIVVTFWQLGQCFESLDCHILMKKIAVSACKT